MKIEKIQIKNLRSFVDVTIPFNDYTCLVGPNGAGKSTVLCALNIFFRETDNASTDLSSLSAEDFHQKNTRDPIEITVTFNGLKEVEKNDFSNYIQDGRLVLMAVANFVDANGKAEVRQLAQRLCMMEFKDFFQAIDAKKSVDELKGIYAVLKQKLPSLSVATTKNAMVESLRKYESENIDKCKYVFQEYQFYGVPKGENILAKYVQWVYVPAVKDATTEQTEAKNTALGKLLARTVRSKINFNENIKKIRGDAQIAYRNLLEENQQILNEISRSLQNKLAEWAHPSATVKLQWNKDSEKSVQISEPFAHIIAGEGDFEGELVRFGHGLQRSYLLALLQELASGDNADESRLILGCEEPELYQHPPQARHLAAVLQNLSEKSSQIVISTHNPIFVSGQGFEDVRMIRRDLINKQSGIAYLSYDDISKDLGLAKGTIPMKPNGVLAKIHQILQPSLNEMFFTQRLVLVEGLEDIAYIITYFNLLGKWDEYRRNGCHIVPANGKSKLLEPLIIAKRMLIPTYLVFDADANDTNTKHIAEHEKDNKALLKFLGSNADHFPAEPIWGKGFVMWHSCIGSIVENDFGKDDWDVAQREATKHFAHAGNLEKNSLHISAALMSAWNKGKRSSHLERLCTEILDSTQSI